MGYEDAPAAKMLATRCACCCKALLDAKSVEIGMGPSCRRKHGYDIACTNEERIAANKVVYEIALMASNVLPETPVALKAATDALVGLGFTVLAARIMARVATVTVTETEGRLAVDTPYDPAIVDAFRRVAGRQWSKEKKVNTFPPAARLALWAVFQRFYPGKLGQGPKGLFVIPARAEVR